MRWNHGPCQDKNWFDVSQDEYGVTVDLGGENGGTGSAEFGLIELRSFIDALVAAEEELRRATPAPDTPSGDLDL